MAFSSGYPLGQKRILPELFAVKRRFNSPEQPEAQRTVIAPGQDQA
jgi:hypothetical protein